MTSMEGDVGAIGPLVLVTGGAGFFGRVLTRRLIDEGLAVRVLDVRSHPDLDPRAELMLGDLRHRETLARAVRGCATVFHVPVGERLKARNSEREPGGTSAENSRA